MLTPSSGLLLSYYITETGPTMTTSSGSGNACLSSVLPIAYIDDLVMHGVMAIGGTQLCSRNANNAQLRAATESHYACVLRGVRLALHDLHPEDTGKMLRILSVLMLMAHYEVGLPLLIVLPKSHSSQACTSTCSNGGIFSHLRASHQLILWLMNSEHQTRSDARYIFGYLLEIYTYLVLANSVMPYGIMDSRHVPYDGVIDNFVSRLSTYETFGIMFAGCHELFELIPAISRFAAQRLKEEEQASTAASLSDSDAFYTSTNARIRDWQQSPPSATNADCVPKRLAIGETYRHVLFIYLETAMLGTTRLPASAEVHARLHEHLVHIKDAVECHNLVTSTFATIMLWPMVITGSVLLPTHERELLAQGLRMPQYATCNSIQTAELLELVWADGDPQSFGPYGLYLAMEKHGINLCLS
jgi:hypothetical protein